ncbi:hypothetical protein [Paraburkholderia sp.]|uniref:hypothetical protein n=1 Tax=Paraburkholderia sp. TaxID=1926495 RepID=UPI002AFF5936|nr:hypothetical protein [Paraburkholderia sp.]
MARVAGGRRCRRAAPARLEAMARPVGATAPSADVSLRARGSVERAGFRVLEEEAVWRNGVS